MRYLLFLLATLLIACPTGGTGVDDDDAVGDDDDAGNGTERGPLSRTMVGWTAGHDTAPLCTIWNLPASPTCNSGVYARFGWLEDTDDLYFSVEIASDSIAAYSSGTLDAGGATGGMVNGLPTDTDISLTTAEGVEVTCQLVWNAVEETYDVNVSSLITPN